jgi:hypothetical protein
MDARALAPQRSLCVDSDAGEKEEVTMAACLLDGALGDVVTATWSRRLGRGHGDVVTATWSRVAVSTPRTQACVTAHGEPGGRRIVSGGAGRGHRGLSPIPPGRHDVAHGTRSHQCDNSVHCSGDCTISAHRTPMRAAERVQCHGAKE